MHTVSENETDKYTDNKDFFIDAITQENDIKDTKQAYADIQVGPSKTADSFKLDTGATANVIPTRVFRALRLKHVLQPSNRPLYGYGGEQLIQRGKCSIKCQFNPVDAKVPHCRHTITPSARIKGMSGLWSHQTHTVYQWHP